MLVRVGRATAVYLKKYIYVSHVYIMQTESSNEK